MQPRHVRPQDLHVVAELRHRADGGPRRTNAVALLDGDRRRDAFDAIHARLVHPIKKLARVGGKGLDVTALAFRKERVECQGTLAAATDARQDHQLIARDIDIQVLQIMRASPTHYDDSSGMTGRIWLSRVRHPISSQY